MKALHRIFSDSNHRMSSVQQLRQQVEQLRREANQQRIPASRAIEDLLAYVTERKNEDYLYVGFPNQKLNPFREKSACSML